MIKQLTIFLSIVLLISSCSGSNSRVLATKYTKEKKYEEAIQEYRNHIQDRLSIADRPEWENPYIYLLDIGDIYLEQGNVDDALATYKEASEHEVKKCYIADRYRYVANWYANKGEIQAALKLLEEHREEDPLLFDLMLDRLARQLVEEEDKECKPEEN